MTNLSILVTAVTGYIGGSVLNQLLTSVLSEVRQCSIDVVTRDDSRAIVFASDAGIRKVHKINDLDDTEAIVRAASQNDVVVNCGPGYHKASALALIEGLARRKQMLESEGKPVAQVYYIHTDGTSNLSSTSPGGCVYSDTDTDIYEELQKLNTKFEYPQRSVALSVVEHGLAQSVPTTIIMSPTIVGLGSGHFNRLTVQYPIIMRAAVRDGSVVYVGEGDGSCRFIHIQDLAKLYELAVVDCFSGRHRLPTGKRGIIFSAVGEYTWREAAAEVAKVGKDLGVLQNGAPQSVFLEEASQAWNVPLHWCEMGFVASQRTKAALAIEILGWEPLTSSKEHWRSAVAEEFAEVVKQLQEGKGGRDWHEEKI